MSENFPDVQVSTSLLCALGSPALVLTLKNAETRAQRGVTLTTRCVYSLFIGADSVMTSSCRSAHLRSNLSFQLKQNHRFFTDSLLGSINIKVDELLDRCKDGEREPRCIPMLDSPLGFTPN